MIAGALFCLTGCHSHYWSCCSSFLLPPPPRKIKQVLAPGKAGEGIVPSTDPCHPSVRYRSSSSLSSRFPLLDASASWSRPPISPQAAMISPTPRTGPRLRPKERRTQPPEQRGCCHPARLLSSCGQVLKRVGPSSSAAGSAQVGWENRGGAAPKPPGPRQGRSRVSGLRPSHRVQAG